nr:tetratricopeptide repeat protein [Bacteroidota bacterium]
MVKTGLLAALLCLIFILVFQPGSLVSGQTIMDYEKDLDLMANDTAKVNLLIKLGKHYCSLENQKSLYYLQEALIISNQVGYDKGIAFSYLWQGRVYYYKDEYSIAKTYLNKAKKLLENMKDNDGLSLYYFASASINNLTGNYIDAIKDNQELIRLSSITGNDLLRSAGLNGLAGTHIRLNEPDEALPYLRESLVIKNQIDDLGGKANILTNIGTAYELMENFDSAMIYYKKGLAIRVFRNDVRRIANSEVAIGGLLIKTQQYEEAIPNLNSAIQHYIDLEEKTGLCITKLKLASAMNYAGNVKQAGAIAGDALKAAKEFHNPALVSQCYEAMAKMAAHNKQYQDAFELGRLHKALSDSLAQANKEEVMKELETRFQVQRKNNQIELLESNNNIQKKNILLLSISIGALISILILIAVLFRLKSRDHGRQLKLFEQDKIIRQQEDKISENEKQLLHGQVESKNRELASKALEMLRVNETIGIIINKLESLNHIYKNQPGASSHINDIVRTLENQTRSNSWEEFDKIFKNIHSEFYENLLKKCPELTASEIKIAALLKLNLSTKEIAAISFKSEEGVKSTRYRLRKKLDLSGDDNLVPFLMQL